MLHHKIEDFGLNFKRWDIELPQKLVDQPNKTNNINELFTAVESASKKEQSGTPFIDTKKEQWRSVLRENEWEKPCQNDENKT